MKRRLTFIELAAIVVLIMVIVAVVGALATGGSDSLDDKIKTCIALGGNPRYTSNADGVVVQYFGCVYP